MKESINIHQGLIDQCQQGNRQALNQVYNLYSSAMYSVSLRITNQVEDAEDILQESFVSAFKNINTYRSEASFGAWLKRIVINKSLNHVKKKKWEFSGMQEETFHNLPEEAENAELEYTVNDVKQALKELPDGYRVIFTLYYFEDFSHLEIADHLNISVSTSKSQLHRAKQKLKERIINTRSHGQRQA